MASRRDENAHGIRGVRVGLDPRGQSDGARGGPLEAARERSQKTSLVQRGKIVTQGEVQRASLAEVRGPDDGLVAPGAAGGRLGKRSRQDVRARLQVETVVELVVGLEALLKPLADGVLAVHPLHREDVSRPMPDFGRIPVRGRRLTTPSNGRRRPFQRTARK